MHYNIHIQKGIATMNIKKLELYIQGYFEINSRDTKDGITMTNNKIEFEAFLPKLMELMTVQIARQVNIPQDCTFRCNITFENDTKSTVSCLVSSIDYDTPLGVTILVT